MRKMFCLLLIVCLLIPSAVFADDTDPIIGCWYAYYDKAIAPEMESAYPDADRYYSVYLFHENGLVYCGGAKIAGTTGTPEYGSCGKWSKADYQYNVGVIGLGEGNAYIDGDSLFVEITDSNGYYMRLRKLLPFNPYQDFVKK